MLVTCEMISRKIANSQGFFFYETSLHTRLIMSDHTIHFVLVSEFKGSVHPKSQKSLCVHLASGGVVKVERSSAAQIQGVKTEL